MAEGADGGRWSRVGGPVGGTFHGEQMGGDGGGATEIGIKRGESHKLRASMTVVLHELPAQSLFTLSKTSGRQKG